MGLLKRILRALPLLLISPLLLAIAIVALALTDLCSKLFPYRPQSRGRKGSGGAASVVIPNWNGKDLLEKYLPSVIAAMSGHADNEIIVVDNGSTDGSVEFVEAYSPRKGVAACGEPRLRWWIERRLSRGAERHRGRC